MFLIICIIKEEYSSLKKYEFSKNFVFEFLIILIIKN
jgi:hypothetical protein